MVKKLNEYHKYETEVYAIAIYNYGEFIGYLTSTYQNYLGGIGIIYTSKFNDSIQHFYNDSTKYTKSYSGMLRYLKRFGKNENDSITDAYGNKLYVGQDDINITFEAENIKDKLNRAGEDEDIYNDRYRKIESITNDIKWNISYSLKVGMSDEDYQKLLSYAEELEASSKEIRNEFR